MSWGSWGWDVLQSTVSAVSETTTLLCMLRTIWISLNNREVNDLAEAIDVPEEEMPREEPQNGELEEKAEKEESTPNTGFQYHSPILEALTTSASYLGTAIQVSGIECYQQLGERSRSGANYGCELRCLEGSGRRNCYNNSGCF